MTHSVLLVGSASLSSQAARDILRSFGHRIVEINDIDLALGALEAVKAEILVLDVMRADAELARMAARAKRAQDGLKVIAVRSDDLGDLPGHAVDASIRTDFFAQGIHGLIKELCDA